MYQKLDLPLKECVRCKREFKPKQRKSTYCSPACKSKLKKRPYLRHRGTCCSFCGFVPVHMCQLDVDHIDGNHANNDPLNLQTLCANCHRLKTQLQRDWGRLAAP
jgi:5-methylcytosine-specific restriction endonuclease McrA